MGSFVSCRLSFLCGLVLGISLLWSGLAASAADAASAPAGAVEESEPNDSEGILEFRIAPKIIASRRRPNPLTANEIAQCRADLAENGPSASVKRDDEYVWMEITPGVKLPDILITEEYQGAEYLLAHNWEPFVMLSEMGWGLLGVSRGEADNVGRPYVGIRFDREGAGFFYYLTSTNIDSCLAIMVQGKVVSAPNISTAIGSHAVITGDFTAEQIDEMIKVLRKKVRPVSTTAVPVTRREVGTYVIPIL
ncbi:MAG: SecDF P1 head subdomain-containing protein, partial [Planctomycetota bacterium]